jgi:integrase/recombinase XerC
MTDGVRADRLRTMTISYATDRYLGELARQGLKPRSIIRYRSFLDRLADMYPHHDVDEVTVDMVRRFLDRITVRVGSSVPLDRDTVSQRVGIVKAFFGWLHDENMIPTDPTVRVVAPRRKNPLENDNIVTVTSEEVQRMLAVAGRDVGLKLTPQDRWRPLLCLGVLAYTGGRRGAVSQLRISAYDGFADPPTLTFQEKGGKPIRKPVATRLAEIIRQAALGGVWGDPDDYLIPSKASPRKAERDARIIYKVVKDVAADAKVISHVHALRAAFAVYFIDNKPDQTLALKDLMGHVDMATTLIYLRRRDRQRNMGVVVDLDWGVESTFDASVLAEKEGFENGDGRTPQNGGAR